MGCTSSSQTQPAGGGRTAYSEDGSYSASVTRQWKVMPSQNEARSAYLTDGTMDANSTAGQLELRALFDYPIAHQILSKYYTILQMPKELAYLDCWFEIQAYKNIRFEKVVGTAAMDIYKKHCLTLPKLDADDLERVQSILFPTNRMRGDSQVAGCAGAGAATAAATTSGDGGSSNSSGAAAAQLDNAEAESNSTAPVKQASNVNPLMTSLFDWLQLICLERLHASFIRFKQHEMYEQLTKILKRKYNNIKGSDFDYFEVLGEGGKYDMMCCAVLYFAVPCPAVRCCTVQYFTVLSAVCAMQGMNFGSCRCLRRISIIFCSCFWFCLCGCLFYICTPLLLLPLLLL